MEANPAPAFTPMTLGLHRSLSVAFCNSSPAVASAAPASMAAITLGRRSSSSIILEVFSYSPPVITPKISDISSRTLPKTNPARTLRIVKAAAKREQQHTTRALSSVFSHFLPPDREARREPIMLRPIVRWACNGTIHGRENIRVPDFTASRSRHPLWVRSSFMCSVAACSSPW